jgi:hypothetical protein
LECGKQGRQRLGAPISRGRVLAAPAAAAAAAAAAARERGRSGDGATSEEISPHSLG